MDKEVVLEEYRNTVAIDSAKARSIIKKLEFGDDFYLLKCIAQTYLDECRFEDTGKMRDYIDKRKWRMAERYIIKAFIINPENAEVLYTMGEIRKLGGLKDIAIYCFETIINMKPKDIAFGKYGRGIAFAQELINDARFELYRLYYEENPRLSKQFLSKYKKGLQKGIETIYKPLENFLIY